MHACVACMLALINSILHARMDACTQDASPDCSLHACRTGIEDMQLHPRIRLLQNLVRMHGTCVILLPRRTLCCRLDRRVSARARPPPPRNSVMHVQAYIYIYIIYIYISCDYEH